MKALFALRMPHGAAAPRSAQPRRGIVGLLVVALAGCATAPPEPPPPPPAPLIVEVPAPERACPTCDDQNREIARLRQELAARDADLRDLRNTNREQAKSLQDSTREVTRAREKTRRLATQADAASYIAEVEVTLAALRAAPTSPATAPLIAMASGFHAATAAPFAQRDYALAMERAAQAEALLAVVATAQSGNSPRGETALQVTIPLRVTIGSNLRRQPHRRAPILSIVDEDSRVFANAWQDGWLRVTVADGRAGWINQNQLGVR
ncbi:MAG: SH3 domain-containing protein [Betaproteobacteria bacterium]